MYVIVVPGHLGVEVYSTQVFSDLQDVYDFLEEYGLDTNKNTQSFIVYELTKPRNLKVTQRVIVDVIHET